MCKEYSGLRRLFKLAPGNLMQEKGSRGHLTVAQWNVWTRTALRCARSSFALSCLRLASIRLPPDVITLDDKCIVL